MYSGVQKLPRVRGGSYTGVLIRPDKSRHKHRWGWHRADNVVIGSRDR